MILRFKTQRTWIFIAGLFTTSLYVQWPTLDAAPVTTYAAPPRDSGPDEEIDGIPADLREIYSKTKSANSIADFTDIISDCRQILDESFRPTSERDYARNLLSWAANRRGEFRSDRAGQLVRSGHVSEAGKLDNLARSDFELSLLFDAKRWRAHHNLGIVKALQGDSQGAMEHFDEVLKLNPKFVNVHFNRGEILYRSGAFAEAIENYSRAIELNANDSGFYTARGHSKLATGDHEGALDDYRKAVSLSPEAPDILTEFADTCQSLAKWKEAAVAYKRAIELDDNYLRAHQNAAWMMATCPDETYRNGDAALRTVSHAVKLSSGRPSAGLLDVLAAAQAATGNFSEAVSTVKEAISATEDQELRDEMQQRLAMYKRKRAFVQSAETETQTENAKVSQSPQKRTPR